MIRKARLSKEQLKVIHALHGIGKEKKNGKRGNSTDTLILYSVKDKKKVRIKNPMFIEHKNGNKHTVIAQGMHKGNNVSQVVKHRG